VPVTALPVEDEESFITAPDELFSEEFILPVSLAEPVPVTALPVPDEELSGIESVVIVVASDESELQDAKQKVAAMKIIIVMCFMIMIII
jgi:RNase P/RNase MRP subunit p30